MSYSNLKNEQFDALLFNDSPRSAKSEKDIIYIAHTKRH